MTDKPLIIIMADGTVQLAPGLTIGAVLQAADMLRQTALNQPIQTPTSLPVTEAPK